MLSGHSWDQEKGDYQIILLRGSMDLVSSGKGVLDISFLPFSLLPVYPNGGICGGTM